jgi:hypothetical protein
MSGPHNPNPNFGNMPPPLPGPGNMPPQQYPQPNPYGQQQAYGNMPPQPPQYNTPPQQPGLSPDAYLNGQGMYPPGFNALDVPIWDPGSDTNTTRPVSMPVAARPPQVGWGIKGLLLARPQGRFIHEERARQRQESRQELYAQRGSEQFWGSLPRLAVFMGRVAFRGTTTPPERRQPGNYRREVGPIRRAGAGAIGAVALIPAVVFAGVRTGVRFYSNFVTHKRTFRDSFRTVVAKEGEAPHQIRGGAPAESEYNNPFPNLGGNLPTSPRQNSANNRTASRARRQAPPAQQQQQRRRQAQPNANRARRSSGKTKRTKEKGI